MVSVLRLGSYVLFAVHEQRTFRMLKSQDIVILIKALQLEHSEWTYRELAAALEMSVSTVHDAIERADICHLFDKQNRSVLRRNLLEFLEHGVRYAFPSRRGSMSRGIPTGHAASPLRSEIRSGDTPPPVWAHAEGLEKGYSLTPLHPTVPDVAMRDEQFYEMLSLIDAIRNGRTRERKIAANLLRDRIKEN